MISHVWPSVGPASVWDLELQTWCMYAEAADEWVTERERAARSAR